MVTKKSSRVFQNQFIPTGKKFAKKIYEEELKIPPQ